LADIALRCGMSASLLSMLERGQVNCTMGTLIGVAHALRVPVSELFHPPREMLEPVIPRALQQVMTGAEGTRRVFVFDRARQLEFSENIFRPGSRTAARPRAHGGWECGVVVEGALELEVSDRSYHLRRGDAFAFNSLRPHRLCNPSKRPACVLWVNLYDDGAAGGNEADGSRRAAGAAGGPRGFVGHRR
jgi:transcriptional regulator with XRE-family HTH domain